LRWSEKKAIFYGYFGGVFASFPGITARLAVKLLPKSLRKWINFGKGGEANWMFHVESVDPQNKLNMPLSTSIPADILAPG
jgi:hypothetical protein